MRTDRAPRARRYAAFSAEAIGVLAFGQRFCYVKPSPFTSRGKPIPVTGEEDARESKNTTRCVGSPERSSNGGVYERHGQATGLRARMAQVVGDKRSGRVRRTREGAAHRPPVIRPIGTSSQPGGNGPITGYLLCDCTRYISAHRGGWHCRFWPSE